MNGSDVTRIPADATAGLGPLVLHHPPGTFALTPASLIAVQALCTHASELGGRGLDWGSGSGVLAITAARVPSVDEVLGLDLNSANVAIAHENARRNDVAETVRFFESDSFSPTSEEGRLALATFAGATDFIVANPPSSSPPDDGFGFRRAVVRGAGAYLRPGGRLLLSVSRQYGMHRIRGLLDLEPRFAYAGVWASTEWVPFDLDRHDLRRALETYVREEARGGALYVFRDPRDSSRDLSARDAFAHHRATGESPLSRWQSHLFVFRG